MRHLPTRPLAAALAGCALALAGCGDDGGSSGSAPKASAMMADALTAAQREKSASMTMTVDARGASSDPQAQQLLAKPLALKLAGGVSDAAIALEGTAGFLGRTEPIGVRSDRRRSFIKYGASWYGPTDGLNASTDGDEQQDLEKAVAAVRKHGDKVVDGKVTEGPDIDGETWQLSGPLNADGLVQIAQAEGEPLDADEQNVLRTIAPLMKVTLAVGQEDKLPRRLALQFKVTKAQIDRLKALADQGSAFPLDAADAKVSVDLTKWGEPVEVTPPRDPQPIDALGGALLGGLMQPGTQ